MKKAKVIKLLNLNDLSFKRCELDNEDDEEEEEDDEEDEVDESESEEEPVRKVDKKAVVVKEVLEWKVELIRTMF